MSLAVTSKEVGMEGAAAAISGPTVEDVHRYEERMAV